MLEIPLNIARFGLIAISSLCMILPASAARKIVDCDVCIYGATSGGVAAAVQAARHGLKVILLDPGHHIGGLSSGGLGATDRGNVNSIGGISSNFYLRIARKYIPNTNSRKYLFEPKVASAVFQDLLSEAAITPLLDEPLTIVRKTGTTIREIETSTGLVVRAGMFIDTTYEGDLLAAAGISFRVGREANATYGETRNGVQIPNTSNFTNFAVDPYIIPGDPASGLITGITPGPPSAFGSADSLVQAYNYRLCLTQAANRLPIAPPPNYNAADYEMVGRYLAVKTAAGSPVNLASFDHGIFHNIGTADGFPNGKSDWNSNKGMSSDWIGHSHEWATATYARRQEIAKDHENYIRGIFQFLRTDPRVPMAIKNEVASWGLPPDEYINNNNWSPQLYVREARRMIGDSILTEANGRGTATASKSIALASYAMDSHYCQRVVVDGKIHTEGGFFELPPRPWPIGLGAITPQSAECTNLLATFALSATHVAYSSARMEPVFMMTSHSAATAAAVALQTQSPIQDISYPKLSTLLKSDGQILEWATTNIGNGILVEAEGAGGNPQPASDWPSGANSGFSGTSYLYAATGPPLRSCTFTPVIPVAGTYKVFMSWVQSSNRATNAKVTITHSTGSEVIYVNQTLDPDGNSPAGGFKDLGTWTFPAGSLPLVKIDNSNANGLIIADAVRFEPTGGLALPATVSLAAHDATTSEEDGNSARVILRREGILSSSLTVALEVSGTATPGTDYTTLPATVTFPANSAEISLTINATPDSLAEGPETLTLSLQNGADYSLSASSTANITLEDTRYDGWRAATFTPAQNADPLLSGPAADPDDDGINNFAESVFSGNPLAGNDLPPFTLALQDSQLTLTLRRSSAAANVAIAIQSSPDLTLWAPASDAILVETTESPDGLTRLETWNLPSTLDANFFRLNL